MADERSISKAIKRTRAASQTAPRSTVRYLGPASMIDVMFEQLEYLLTHECQTAGCQDCQRLKGVSAWLLLPFRTSGRT